jgi:glycine/D-amino acid oxidase-like deaminating enzyme
MRVAVLGAGLTGVGTALELAKRGVSVTLVDQDPRPMNRASLRNEGKIHLGLIYANAGSLRTAAQQLNGALRFRSLLGRWIGCHAERLERSTPFWYVVANDSLLSADRLAEHYGALQSLYEESVSDDRSLDYLGKRPQRLWDWCQRQTLEQHLNGDRFIAGFKTEEVAIDTDELARTLRAAVADSPFIQFLPEHSVRGVVRRHGFLRVEGTAPEGSWTIEADHVVNALWENRLAIDATLGIAAAPGWLYRLKYRVIARLPERLRDGPSVTMVLGAYGDVVIRRDGTAYLSWYPSGLQGWSHELAPPAGWAPACRGDVPEGDARRMAMEIIRHIDAWYPGIGECEPLVVDAGAIVAYGHTDVDDRSSVLHDRSRIGVVSHDGYHSADPGKLTTAPMVAVQAADAVIGQAVAL